MQKVALEMHGLFAPGLRSWGWSLFTLGPRFKLEMNLVDPGIVLLESLNSSARSAISACSPC